MLNDHINVIGLMSGTSLDGLDLSFVSFNKNDLSKYNIIHTKTFLYENKWIKKLKEAIYLNKIEVKKLDNDYAELLAYYVKKFIKEFSISKVDLISSHGHTVFHQPEKKKTLQIGNGYIINKILKLKVVCDFRTQDIKYNGQGAPLVPIGDLNLFSDYKFCLNLGGFSNISIKRSNMIEAFDICPVNTVLNYYSKKLGSDYDKNGKLSKKGVVNNDLLNKLNEIEFYKISGPKSLGVEFVNSTVFPLIEAYMMKPNDILKTYIEHISHQINFTVSNFSKNKILVTGGGTYNKTLISSMKRKIKHKLVIPEKNLIDFKEATIFAYMGLLKIMGKINCLKSVTGAIKNHSSGKIFKN
jgi:anhydro-N-acetylmuramic acid kinase